MGTISTYETRRRFFRVHWKIWLLDQISFLFQKTFASPQEENMNGKCIVFAFFMVVCCIHLTSCQPTRNNQDPCIIQISEDCDHYLYEPIKDRNIEEHQNSIKEHQRNANEKEERSLKDVQD